MRVIQKIFVWKSFKLSEMNQYYYIVYQAISQRAGVQVWTAVISEQPDDYVAKVAETERRLEGEYDNFELTFSKPVSQEEYDKYKTAYWE